MRIKKHVYPPIIIGHATIVKSLVDYGSDVDSCEDRDLRTALFVASQNKHSLCVQLLIENKANINKASKDGTTPLLMAVNNNNYYIAKILLDCDKIDLLNCNQSGLNIFLIAAGCISAHYRMLDLIYCKLMITFDYQTVYSFIHSTNNQKCTALHLSCHNNLPIFKLNYLCQINVNPFLTDCDGNPTSFF